MPIYRNRFVQINQYLILSAFVFICFSVNAQTTYIPLGSKEYNLIDRLEIKTRMEGLTFSQVKPYARRSVVQNAEMIDSILQTNSSYAGITAIDRENMQRFFMNNSEWSKPRDSYKSHKPVFGDNGIYKTKGNLLEVNKGDLFLAINPVVYFTAGKENNNDKILYQNTRGITARGMISRRLGFNAYFTENQERDPLYVQSWISQNLAVPGAGNYKTTAYGITGGVADYFDARGSVTWNVAKYVDMQFGYDKNFIGNGFRSLYLSDFSNNATFLKINTKIWKFNYENLFFELYDKHDPSGGTVFPRKYARVNYLNINANKWLNVGVFESVVFGRQNHFDIQYMIPVMFIRPAESNIGSGDNSMVGFDAKANIAGKFQVYSQILFDELKVKDWLSKNGWWANKQGYQFGVKYIDALGVKNLDLQGEVNFVRPYTYQHFDSVSSYSHYNQPFAHPLGANFKEFIGIAKWQPTQKLYIQITGMHYMQGLDSGGINFGSRPLELYTNRPYENGVIKDYGYRIGDGLKVNTNIVQGIISYEFKENMFVDLTGFYRNYKVANAEAQNTTTVSLSFRWNIGRREFMF